MKELVSHTHNLLYDKADDGTIEPVHELVFITTEVEYQYSNTKDIVKNRVLATERFLVSHKHIDKVIAALQEMKKQAENEFKTLKLPS